MSKYKLLTRYIPELLAGKGAAPKDSTPKVRHTGTMEDPIIMFQCLYSETADSLHADIYNFYESHPEYRQAQYYDVLEANGLKWEYDSMVSADVSVLDAEAVMALLIGACRAERFCDGAFQEFIDSGAMTGWLKRLEELDESLPETESTITIVKKGITKLDTDCIVNAANTGLKEGGGVCGAVFREAGVDELKEACDKYVKCDVGRAVITPGFRLKAKYIIHAVGPRWTGGDNGERGDLYCCYQEAMRLAEENGCRTIAFPVISSGIFGYPKKEAWEVGLQSVRDYELKHEKYKLDTVFAVTSDESYELGNSILPALR